MKKLIIHPVVTICSALLLLPATNLAVLAQPSPAAAIDQAFRTNQVPPGVPRDFIPNLKKWLGEYQKVTKGMGMYKNSKYYMAIFDRGVLPVEISLAGVGIRCPLTKLPLTKAPSNIQKAFAECPNLKKQ